MKTESKNGTKFQWRCFLALMLACLGFGLDLSAKPIALHPDNPHYFLWDGRPTVLITSGEHYGAVLNLDFDYKTYLKTLHKDGLNLTRTFTGVYAEPVGAFRIERNTLAPAPGKLIAPWRRSEVPGYAKGGNKFDLHRWDPAYFERLNDFMKQAQQQGVVVELNLFCPMYEESMWALSPMNAVNNVQGLGALARTNVYTLDRSGPLLAVQEALVRKLVTELNKFDNLYFEICNEPYFGGVTLEWQMRMAAVIEETERSLPKRHLIAQNIANDKARVTHPSPLISIFNFHYASPPDAVAMNYDLNRVIGDNETGFKGTNDTHYRMEAWQFILAGGGLFNHLDYSFVAGHESGDFVFPATQPGGGGIAYRKQLSHLVRFMNQFEFVRMKPDLSFVKSAIPEGCKIYALAEEGRQYALHLFGKRPRQLDLTLPKGRYQIEWMDPVSGLMLGRNTLRHGGGTMILLSPEGKTELAIRILSLR